MSVHHSRCFRRSLPNILVRRHASALAASSNSGTLTAGALWRTPWSASILKMKIGRLTPWQELAPTSGFQGSLNSGKGISMKRPRQRQVPWSRRSVGCASMIFGEATVCIPGPATQFLPATNSRSLKTRHPSAKAASPNGPRDKGFASRKAGARDPVSNGEPLGRVEFPAPATRLAACEMAQHLTTRSPPCVSYGRLNSRASFGVGSAGNCPMRCIAFASSIKWSSRAVNSTGLAAASQRK